MGAPQLSVSFFDESVGHAFIAAAIKTIESYTQAKSEFNKKHQIAKDLQVEYPVAGYLNFEADGLKVQMTLAFKKEVILHIYEHMLSTTVTEIDEDVKDCIGELSNIVYGYAKAPLVDMGHKFSMAVPSLTSDLTTLLKNKKSLEIPFKIHDYERGFSLILSL